MPPNPPPPPSAKHNDSRHLRCEKWHYNWTGVYMITLVQTNRATPLLGEMLVSHTTTDPASCQIKLSPLGKAVAECWLKINSFHPDVEPLDFQIMPDHLHGILRVKRELKRSIGEVIRGFKIGCTKAYRAIHGETASQSLWEENYHDSIAFSEERLSRMIAYIKDNPRRLALKRANPALFRVLHNIPFKGGYFSAIGNRFLLDSPCFIQVQCSRSRSPEEALADFHAIYGAKLALSPVIVSPCISPGEKAIARYAMENKIPLIALLNKGFSPYTKPPGPYLDACADGRLLMLAPSAWPYIPGKKPITRLDACILNRIAQHICGPDATPINYKGLKPLDLDTHLALALTPPR